MFSVVGHGFSLMWISDISWCWRSWMDVPWCFFGRQENNADIDDGKDVTKDVSVSAESAEDSQQNLQVCLLGKLFWILQCKSCSFLGRKKLFNQSKSILSNLRWQTERKMQRGLRLERSLDEKVRCQKVKTWLCQDSWFLFPSKKIHAGFIFSWRTLELCLGVLRMYRGDEQLRDDLQPCEYHDGQWLGSQFLPHFNWERVGPLKRHPWIFWGVHVCLNDTQVVLKVSKQNCQTTQAGRYVHYSWFTLMFLLIIERLPFMFEYIVHLGKPRILRLVSEIRPSQHSPPSGWP